ncbi:MAG TPA: hypothetical protein VK399_04800 [Longimicrobiaceae bacterium]|nr:hypothetical protein [Longimicrobiaceae bacterium]
MASPVRLSVLIGPAVPVPVPQSVLDALVRVQVVTTAGETSSGFELTFSLARGSPLQTLFLLSGGSSIPLVRVVLVATVNGTPEVLMDGVMTHHELAPGESGGPATLTIKGKDLTAVMDYLDFSGMLYPAMPPEARVALIVAKYAVFGVLPVVLPSVLIDVPIPVDRIPTQQGTDLAYVTRLAEEVGYTFYVSPGPVPGASVAYWGPEIRLGIPQPALNVDMDAHTNVEKLSFTFDTESKELPILVIQEPRSKALIPIPIPDITPLSPPLGLVPPIPKKVYIIDGTAKLGPIRSALLGLAKAARSSDAVSATGTLDVARYGRVLRARGLVGVRGAGSAFDGLYYVKKVTHTLSRGEYKQEFTLARNGLISTLSQVPA